MLLTTRNQPERDMNSTRTHKEFVDRMFEAHERMNRPRISKSMKAFAAVLYLLAWTNCSAYIYQSAHISAPQSASWPAAVALGSMWPVFTPVVIVIAVVDKIN